LGSAYGTAKASVGIASMGIMSPDDVMKQLIPVIMAGILGIYGLIVAIVVQQKIVSNNYSAYMGYAHLAAGLACGLSSLGAGFAIGIVGDSGVRANGQMPRLYVPMVIMLIFGEALGLYGLIIGVILGSKSDS
jgi:V-type H+-transporting ATPase proteolipid subunit